MIKTKIWTALYLLLPALLLSSCSYVSTSNLDLMQAPILNQRQAELQEALARTLNLSEIVYCYPLSGEHRSPFIFQDLDGDGVDEAIVLYAFSSNTDEVRVKMLRQGDGGWISFYDIAGQGSQVQFVDFSHLLSQDSRCMVIGWNLPDSNVNILEVYSLIDGAFNRQALREYNSYSIHDFNGDGLSEVALISPAVGGSYEMVLLKGMGTHIAVADTLPMEPDAEIILQMLQGKLANGDVAFFIDEEHENGTVGTEVIGVSDSSFVAVACSQSPVESEQYSYYASTFRGERVLCVDIFHDQIIEVPRMQELPSTVQTDDPNVLELTEYRHLGDDGYKSAYHAVVNVSEGYLLFFPERWLGQVTVVQRPEVREWQFYKVDPDTSDPILELLRIRVHVAGDYIDRFTQSYTLLEVRGAFSYYGYVPDRSVSADPLVITAQEAEQLFLLL